MKKSYVYANKLGNQISIDQKCLIPATTELIQLNNKWQHQIKNEKERRRNACTNASIGKYSVEQNDIDESQMIEAIDSGAPSNFDNDDQLLDFMCTIPVTKITIPGEPTRNDIAQRFTINKNQKAAFMIITGHLDGMDKINGGNIMKEICPSLNLLLISKDGRPDQLIMCVPGCGGTGKSQLIRAITAYFTETNRVHKLQKLAPTSVAAAEIDGMTIHSFLVDGRNRKAKSKAMNRSGHMMLENIWRFVKYIILDEISMVGFSLFARLSTLVQLQNILIL